MLSEHIRQQRESDSEAFSARAQTRIDAAIAQAKPAEPVTFDQLIAVFLDSPYGLPEAFYHARRVARRARKERTGR